MDEVTKEFLAESLEGLDAFDRHMVELEGAPRNTELLTAIFRIVHTIKGTCGFLGFVRLERLTHTGENLLAQLRDGKLDPDEAIISALLALGDAMRRILAAIETTGAEPDEDWSALVARLTEVQSGSAAAGATAAPAPKGAPEPPAPAGPDLEAANQPGPTPAGAEPTTAPDAEPEATRPALEADGFPPDRRVAERRAPPRPEVSLEADHKEARAESSVRLDVAVLDSLMNLVGEMVLTRNQILQLTGSSADAALSQACQRLNQLTSELQEGVMKTRMQPIGQVWNRFPRLVRDVSLACSKRVRLETNGKDTELDRTVLEAIRDPLVHILRNAIDHGIETPEARVAAGKPEEGLIRLNAWHEGGLVHIEIADDGAGVNPARVLAKAIERGLVPPDGRLSDRDIVNLVFRPGFSTAASVTSISGRGVGMDVVKTNVERIGGTVDLRSQPGRGSVVRISIPLTLAIIPVLIVRAGEARYAIPQVNLVELVRVDAQAGPGGIETVEGCQVYRLRNQLLPVIDLSGALGTTPTGSGNRVNLVVVQAGGRAFGLRVDQVCDTEEIVVKPIDRFLQGLPCYTGVTILGDGTVALILDVGGLARMAALEIRDDTPADTAANNVDGFGDASGDAVLLLGIGGERRVAIPLSAVARIEEVPHESLEYADGQPVIQYRGQIIPVVSLTERFGEMGGAPDGRVPVVIHRQGGFAMGLAADRILDVVNNVPSVTPSGRARPGIRGSAVIGDRVTDVIDVGALVAELTLDAMVA